MKRRNFIKSAGGILLFPAIVRAESLMRVVAPKSVDLITIERVDIHTLPSLQDIKEGYAITLIHMGGKRLEVRERETGQELGTYYSTEDRGTYTPSADRKHWIVSDEHITIHCSLSLT